jgi:hypothetical protein
VGKKMHGERYWGGTVIVYTVYVTLAEQFEFALCLSQSKSWSTLHSTLKKSSHKLGRTNTTYNVLTSLQFFAGSQKGLNIIAMQSWIVNVM